MADSQQSPTTSTHYNVFDELRWVIQIRQSLEEAIEDDNGIPVSIFNVPKALQACKPESYSPQLIAIGPYHHWRPDLYDMERYKLAAAKRTQKHLQSLKLQELVDHFMKLEQCIRAHYHRYLDFNGETLAWMMVVDASFLLEFLEIFGVEEGKGLKRVSSRLSHLVDFAGRKSGHNVILRDIMMLENQIPLLLLMQVLDLQCSSGVERLTVMVSGLMKELCPLKMAESFPAIDVTRSAHLLELLYNILVPTEQHCETEAAEEEIEEAAGDEKIYENENSSYVKQLLQAICTFSCIKQVILSRPIKFLAKLPWKILTSLPGLKVLKQPLEYLFSSQTDGTATPEDPSINKPPLVEEITIPSVTELVDAGVRFSPTNGDLTTISFDPKSVVLYLPTVSLDLNTEVVLRNLVAYEASAASGPLVLARYTELMNGIIDGDGDVRLLRQCGVVVNRMKSDKEVARVWNGMTRSVRLTRVSFIDKVIEDVNEYHGSRWRVKTGKFMKRYVFGSWQFLTFLAAVLLLLLTTFQAFCSVYSCARWFGLKDEVHYSLGR